MYKCMTLYILCIGAFVRFVRKSISMLDFGPWDNNILITGPAAAGVEAYVYILPYTGGVRHRLDRGRVITCIVQSYTSRGKFPPKKLIIIPSYILLVKIINNKSVAATHCTCFG